MNWAVGVSAFAIAAAYWPGWYGAGSASRMICMSVCVPVLLLFIRIRPTAAHWLLGLFVAYAAISGFWGLVLTEWAFGLWLTILCFGAFAIGAESRSSEPLLIGSGLGLCLSAVACVFQATGHWPWDQVVGPSGLFVNKNFLAEAAALTGIGLALYRRWVLAAVCGFCVLAAKSKGAWLAVAVAALLWTYRRSKVAAVGLVVVMICAGAVAINRVDSLDIRLEVWGDAVRGLTWMGSGIGEYFVDVPRVAKNLNAQFARVEYAHNEYLHFAYEAGVGAVLLFGFLWRCVSWAEERERLALVGLLVMACFSFPLHLPGTAFVGFFLAGRACHGRPVLGLSELQGRAVVCARSARAMAEGLVRKNRQGGRHLPVRPPA